MEQEEEEEEEKKRELVPGCVPACASACASACVPACVRIRYTLGVRFVCVLVSVCGEIALSSYLYDKSVDGPSDLLHEGRCDQSEARRAEREREKGRGKVQRAAAFWLANFEIEQHKALRGEGLWGVSSSIMCKRLYKHAGSSPRQACAIAAGRRCRLVVESGKTRVQFAKEFGIEHACTWSIVRSLSLSLSIYIYIHIRGGGLVRLLRKDCLIFKK